MSHGIEKTSLMGGEVQGRCHGGAIQEQGDLTQGSPCLSFSGSCRSCGSVGGRVPFFEDEMGRSDLEIQPRAQAPYLLNPRGVWKGPWGSIWVIV